MVLHIFIWPILVIHEFEIQQDLMLIYMAFGNFYNNSKVDIAFRGSDVWKIDFYQITIPVSPFGLTIYNKNKTNLPKVIKVELNFSTLIFFFIRIKWNGKDFVWLSDT